MRTIASNPIVNDAGATRFEPVKNNLFKRIADLSFERSVFKPCRDGIAITRSRDFTRPAVLEPKWAKLPAWYLFSALWT